MLKVEYLNNEKLNAEDMDYIGIEERDEDNYSTYLKVTHNDKIISIQCDGGEPEDQTFGRDWSWVSSLLEKVYKLGVEDGKSKEV